MCSRLWSRCRTVMVLLLGSIWGLSAVAAGSVTGDTCPRCGWAPPRTRDDLSVRSTSELEVALRRALPGTTIRLEDGTYLLGRMLDVPVPNLVLRSRSGDRSKVVLRGEGMEEHKVGVAISISAPRVTLADLTVGAVGFHGIQVRGERGASRVAIHNVRVVDTGQQLIKGSVGGDGRGADEGLLACSTLQYSDHAPSNYTNGVDVLGAKGWVVRDNNFFRIRGPRSQGWQAGPAVLFWAGAEGTRVERNWVVDCFRGIALGLRAGHDGPSRDGAERFEHRGGVIRRNVICNLNPWADEGIEANGAPEVRIEHNTILVEGTLPWSISVRFPATSGLVRNNLTNRPIQLRDGARAELAGNVSDARRDWFINAAQGDLRLARGDVAAIDAGVPIPESRRDADPRLRISGRAPEAGAFEFFGNDDRPPG